MNTVILLAAGKSLRAGQDKLWVEIVGKPLWTHSYKTFLEHSDIDHIILVVPKGEEFKFLPFLDGKKTQVVSGRETRMESFKAGLAAVAKLTNEDIIIDHNAANPWVTNQEISAVIVTAKKFGAAAVSHPAVDTVMEAKDGFYIAALPREKIRLMQTPQAVRGDILQSTLLGEATDLATALIGKTEIHLVEASPANKKITFAEDLDALRMQTFLGEDSHSFGTSGQLTLGGLKVPALPALEANSDGDVILHAIGRALAQACGQNFSEVADPLSLSGDQDSRDYLEPLLSKVKIQQVSLSFECARPQIDPITSELKSSLGKILGIQPEQIHLSAHTGEGLTSFGRGEGIRCLALLTVLPLN
ncbi:MAG: 2-C-methyl-D-erythritol 2,4-cyclodiphosphate synthase [Candidatus Gracilibacteria bacterium]